MLERSDIQDQEGVLRPDCCPALSKHFELLRFQFGQVLDELWTFLFLCCMDSVSVTVLLPVALCGTSQYIVFWAGHMRALCLYLIVFPAQFCVQSVCEQ
jgi:hypothetical protein